MCGGVGKSGSPAPNPITRSPAACSALALASTASVADSAIAPILRDTRAGSTGLLIPASSHPARQRAERVSRVRSGDVRFGRRVPLVQVLEAGVVREDLDDWPPERQPSHHAAHLVLLVPQHER